MHFKTTICQTPKSWDVVCPDLSFGGITLLALGTVEHNIEIDEIEVIERVLGARGTEYVEGCIDPLELGLKEHDRAGREVAWDDDIGVRALSVASLCGLHCVEYLELVRQTVERVRLLCTLARGLERNSVDKLGLSTTQTYGLDYRDVSSRMARNVSYSLKPRSLLPREPANAV